MESMHSGFITKAPVLPAHQLASPSSGVHSVRFKRWNNADRKQIADLQPAISQRRLLTRHRAGFRAHCWKRGEVNHSKTITLLKTFQGILVAFPRFIKPPILIGLACSTISFSLLAVEKLSDISPLFLVVVCQAIVSAWFMHVYISGVNQLTDIEIDKSFLIGWMVGSRPLLSSLFSSFVVGTIYSIKSPFSRWKRNPFAASLSIVSFYVTWLLGSYLNTQTFVLGRPTIFSKAAMVGTTFLCIYVVSLSQYKDITDIEGDKIDGIQTLAVRFGTQKVFWSCLGLVQFAYLVFVLASLTLPNSWRKCILVASHVLLASLVWSRAQSVDLENKAAIESFYGFLCKLTVPEYILIHLMR